MRSKVLFACLATLVLSGCVSNWFGHDRHPRGPRPVGEEWHPPREILLKYDSNHDGTLTRAELEAGLRADFDKADTNHDGRLDIDEIRAVNQARWTADSSTASPLVDWNHDGFVDFNEFAATARSLFDQMDTDGDGKLAPDELNPQRAGPRGEDGRGGHRRGGGGDEGPDGGGAPDPDGQ